MELIICVKLTTSVALDGSIVVISPPTDQFRSCSFLVLCFWLQALKAKAAKATPVKANLLDDILIPPIRCISTALNVSAYIIVTLTFSTSSHAFIMSNAKKDQIRNLLQNKSSIPLSPRDAALSG